MQRIARKFKSRYRRPLLYIVVIYVVMTFLMGLVLQLPFLLADGQSVTFLDGMFMSSSAIATTGLATVDFTQVYNYWGWLVFILMFNVGGVGIIVTNTLVLLLLGKKIGMSNRMLAKLDYNKTDMKDIVTITKRVIIIFWTIEFIGAVLIFFLFGQYFDNTLERFMNALFLSASAVSGSGFYNTNPYQSDFVLQAVLIFLMIFSFLGYPVVMDIFAKIKAWRNKEKYQITVFTKIVLKMNLITVILFAIIFWGIEFNKTMEGFTLFEQAAYSLYMSVSTKSVGLSVFSDFSQFSGVTLLFFTVFMIIGGAPSSACGGVKVMSVYIIYKHIISYIKNGGKIIIYGFKVPDQNVLKSYFLVVSFVTISFLSTVVIELLNPKINFSDIWFDVVSGFTTTGFSTGALAQMNAAALTIITILMIVGRIGLLNLAGIVNEKKKEDDKRVTYIEKELPI